MIIREVLFFKDIINFIITYFIIVMMQLFYLIDDERIVFERTGRHRLKALKNGVVLRILITLSCETVVPMTA